MKFLDSRIVAKTITSICFQISENVDFNKEKLNDQLKDQILCEAFEVINWRLQQH